MVSYTLSREYRVARSRYSRLLFTSEDRLCACKNNRRIWRHNAGNPRSRDVTDQLLWRHNTKSEKTVLSDNGEIGKLLFSVELCVQGHKIALRNKIVHSLPWWRFLGHSWGDLPIIFTRDFVTREKHWQIASLVTQKSLFTVTHALFFISWLCLPVSILVKYAAEGRQWPKNDFLHHQACCLRASFWTC